MATPTRKRKYEEVRWSLSRSSLAVRCAGVSAFRFPIVGVVSLVAIWDGHGRSVDARGPVYHDSVGLAQARPNYQSFAWCQTERRECSLDNRLGYRFKLFAYNCISLYFF